MTDVLNFSAARELLEEFGLSPNKRLGQNFLCDPGVVARIAEAAGITHEDAVLEIGPGLGALTRELSKRAKKVVAVEIDSGLVEALGKTLADCPNISVLHADFLKADLGELYEALGGGAFRVAANLPYYITTPVILRLLESGLPVRSMSFLVQKEVAERMAAKPSSKSYGALSLAVQYYTDASIVLRVPPSCFYPAPSVDSIVIRLDVRPPKVQVASEEDFFRITRAAFAMRRKTLANGLSAGLGLPRAQAEALILAAGLPANVRGEALSIEQFAALANAYTQGAF